MTIYYLSSVDGSDASDGLSWDNAYATFKYAVETASAAASGPHLLYVDSAHSESLSADTTITAAGDIRILCVNRSTGALATSAVVGAQSTAYSITIAGAKICYFRGINFSCGTANTNKYIYLGTSDDGAHYEFHSCTFTLPAGSSAFISIGSATAGRSSFIKLSDCTITFSVNSQAIRQCGGGFFVYENLTIGGTAPTTLIKSDGVAPGAIVRYEACDLSAITGTLVGAVGGNGIWDIRFINCKFGSGVTIKAAAATILNLGTENIACFNCDAGDVRYLLYHGSAFGETTATVPRTGGNLNASVYANDGAAYDGTNKCSWKIVTTANCSYYTPYVSPWMDAYHSGTSAITPYLEALRSGSTTAYYDDEVWSEWSYQGTSGSTKATIVNDRMTPLGSRAAQTSSSLDASGWTGEDATNNWFGKLEAGSITPAEIGHLCARVVVGLASATVYVDPQIRATGVTSGINRVTPTGWLQQPAASGGGLLTHPGMGGGARG